MRGPVTPVCRVVVPCDAPFSAGFTVQHAGRLVAQFQSDSAGQFTVFLDPGGYTVVPNADAPLISPAAQAKSVTVGDTAQCPISEPSLRSASLRRATTIIEEPAETLTPANPADMVFRFGCTLDQLVISPTDIRSPEAGEPSYGTLRVGSHEQARSGLKDLATKHVALNKLIDAQLARLS